MRILLTISVAALLSLLACSTDKGPQDPGTDPPDDDDLIAEADIGTEGGSLGDGTVTITIADGEFEETASLELYELGDPQQSHEVTSLYRLEGLPRDCTVGVSIVAPLAGTQGNYLQVWDEDLPILFPADLSEGRLVAEIVVLEAERSDEDVMAEFLGVTDIVAYDYPDTPNRRFRVEVPAHRQAAVEEVLADLVTSANALEAAGVDFTGYDEEDAENVSLDVMKVALKFNPEIDPYSGSVRLSFRYRRFQEEGSIQGYLTIAADGLDNSHRLATAMEAQGEMVLELAKIALETYNADEFRHAWLLWGARRWAEMRFGPGGIDSVVLEDEQVLATLTGLYQGSSPIEDPNIANFSLGMSDFLHWACNDNRWGLEFFAKLLDEDEAATPENLILAFGDDSSDIWWHDWVQDYVGAEVTDYGDLVFVNFAEGNWSINEVEDTNYVFSADYADLSANCFNIRLDHSYFNETSKAHFSLSSAELDTENLKIHVYKRLGGSLSHLASGSEVIIEGLREYRIQGAHLLVAVSNSYYQSPFDLKRGANLIVNIEEEPEGGVFDLHSCEIRMESVAEYLHYEGNDCTQADHWVTNQFMFPLEGGSWSGSTFTLFFDNSYTEPQTYRNHGALSIEMNEEGTEAHSFLLDWTQVVSYGNTESTEHIVMNWSGGELLHGSAGDWDETFEYTGSELENHLSFQRVLSSTANDCIRSSTDINSNSNSEMILGFTP